MDLVFLHDSLNAVIMNENVVSAIKRKEVERFSSRPASFLLIWIKYIQTKKGKRYEIQGMVGGMA